ncbi:transmembrane protein 180-like [Sycon ciliatum]|uniref:transmembrane protein 180-like n=1 Tax=Sycon ciliatum TaxID=27933 RepID=UPI0031F608C4
MRRLLPDFSSPEQRNALGYAATTLAASMMNSIFQFYYVKLYLDVYRLSSGWFQAGQVIFLVWNAINDPLFGWLQDTSKVSWLSDRKKNILYGAPLFVLSFLVPWFPQYLHGVPMWVLGTHMVLVLCFYDTMFTFVLLAQCALFTELSPNQEDRQRLVKYSQVASIVGSSSVYFSQVISSNATDVSRLSTFCVVIAVLSYCFLYLSAKNMSPAVIRDSSAASSLSGHNDATSTAGDAASFYTWLSQVKQIMKQPNFLLFVGMNFCQIFHTTFRSNFFAVFADHLIGLRFGVEFLHFIAGLAYVLPQVVVLLAGTALARWGSYNLVMWSFVFKVVASLAMFVAGRHALLLLAVFFVLDRGVAEATFSLFNLSLSDIIDADSSRHRRQQPCSSTVFGLNALFTKPAQSLAPIFTVQIMDMYGYTRGIGLTAMEGAPAATLADGMFLLLCGLPTLLGAIQLLLWKFYTLRSTHTASLLLPTDVR